MADSLSDKTLEPTPHRRQQARQEGHVAKSHDLASAAFLLLGLAVLLMLGNGFAGFLVAYSRNQLGGQPWLTLNVDLVAEQWNSTLWAVARYALPILGLICLAGIAAHVLQIGFLFHPQRLALDLGRLSPLRGFQRIFSVTSVVRLGFGSLKLLIVFGVSCLVLYHEGDALLSLAALSPPALGRQMTSLLIWTGLKIGAALFVLAMLDYAYQWWRHERDLRMTPQELREELRNVEGNPQVVARRKQLQRTQSSQRVSAVETPSPVETQADRLKSRRS